MLVGVVGAVGMAFAGVESLLGFHTGVVAWAVNLGLCVGLSSFWPSDGGSPDAELSGAA
jgi:hypothetical protein